MPARSGIEASRLHDAASLIEVDPHQVVVANTLRPTGEPGPGPGPGFDIGSARSLHDGTEHAADAGGQRHRHRAPQRDASSAGEHRRAPGARRHRAQHRETDQ